MRNQREIKRNLSYLFFVDLLSPWLPYEFQRPFSSLPEKNVNIIIGRKSSVILKGK
jgi:hypothetical protein